MKKFNVYKAGSAAAILLAVMVIFAELVKPFKEILKNIFWHHWIGKVVLMSVVFLIVGYLYKDKISLADEKFAWKSVLASLAAILLFYIIHYFI